MTDPPPVIVWFRQDLRLTDNPALAAALERHARIVPLFVLDDYAAGQWRAGGAPRWWLHHSLVALAGDLVQRGARLLLRRGRVEQVIPEVVRATGAGSVHAMRCVEPWARHQEAGVDHALRSLSSNLILHQSATLFDPEAIRTRSNHPYTVYTPFAWACHAAALLPEPQPAPRNIPGVAGASDRLDDWHLLPTHPDWAGGLRRAWEPGEAGARRRLDDFLHNHGGHYVTDRDRPDRDGTSRLSPHLHFGEISPATVWHAIRDHIAHAPSRDKLIAELLWREFAAHLLWHFPTMPEQPLRASFAAMPWRHDPASLRAWQRGRTGIPIVDAGMRQLWHTGWMHNRVRMIAASFLTKHLLLPWQEGAAWFWDTLVDADLANNSAGWQWVAGSGADAAPYFRVFNPVLQGRTFDPDAAYVHAWVPELRGLDPKHAHAPWEAPALLLQAAGVALGATYPSPIVGLDEGRRRALAAYNALPRQGSLPSACQQSAGSHAPEPGADRHSRQRLQRAPSPAQRRRDQFPRRTRPDR